MKFNLLRPFYLASSITISTALTFSPTLLDAHVDQVGPRSETSIRQIIEFEPKSNELPGTVITGLKHDIYISFPFMHQIRRYTIMGEFLDAVRLPIHKDNLVEGLAIKWNGDLFAVVNTYYSNHIHAHGIWKISHDGCIEKFADIPTGGFPSNIVFDKSDHLYLTDAVLGKIWKIDREGNVQTWLCHPHLKGKPSGYFVLGIPQGANGIAMGKKCKNVYVGNTDYGKIIRIKINQDGSAGKVKVFANCDLLKGVGGISFNRRGILYAAVPYQNKILSIREKDHVEEIICGEPLEFPGSIAMKKHKGINLGFSTNTALFHRCNPGIFRIKVASDPLHAD